MGCETMSFYKEYWSSRGKKNACGRSTSEVDRTLQISRTPAFSCFLRINGGRFVMIRGRNAELLTERFKASPARG